MKLLIIGLDALDKELVEKWGMKEWFVIGDYGSHYVGFLKTLYTPLIWSCFLTGLNVEELGYNIDYISEERGKKLYGKLYPLYLLRKKLIKRELGIRKILYRLGFFGDTMYTPNMPVAMKKKSFIDFIKEMGYRVSAIEVPGYNEEKNEYFRSMLAKIIKMNPLERRRIVYEALLDTLGRVRKTIYFIRKEYELIFMYSPLPDLAFHTILKKPKTADIIWLRKIHYKLYLIVRPLIELAKKKNYNILIVSDHGFDLDKLYHSNYGFWSSNIQGFFNDVKTVTDFKKKIIELFR